MMAYGLLAPNLKESMGVTESLITLSIGLEDPQDLTADLEGPLKKAFAG